jgi:epoxyqueuosine reductase
MSLEREIAAAAHQQGFVLVGFARLRRLAERDEFFARWVADGRPGDMSYLTREPERRFDPRRLDARLRSVVSLGYPYAAPAPPTVDWRAELRGRIAAYAFGPDYHDRVLSAARAVAAMITTACPGAVTRAYVDTGPVFERDWATAAGLGWFGKNTNLLNRDHGSYFFLSEIFTDIDLEPSGEFGLDHCGTCRRCLDLCPTNALADGYLMEPRACISYLTIENRGPIPVELRPKLGAWVFGCDICQQVCPWNDGHHANALEDLAPSLPELMVLDDEGFRRRYGKSAVRRAKRRGLLRNVAVALGNSGNPAAVAPLARALESEPEALVRAHAAWALGRLGTGAARSALEHQLRCEPDSEVSRELRAARAEIGSAALAKQVSPVGHSA